MSQSLYLFADNIVIDRLKRTYGFEPSPYNNYLELISGNLALRDFFRENVDSRIATEMSDDAADFFRDKSDLATVYVTNYNELRQAISNTPKSDNFNFSCPEIRAAKHVLTTLNYLSNYHYSQVNLYWTII